MNTAFSPAPPLSPAAVVTPAHRQSRRRGFSLVEILIVIALIGAIAALAISNVGGIFGSQQEKVAKHFVTDTVRTALLAYRIDVGGFPTSEQGLQALVRAPDGIGARWRGPYLEATTVPLDPWGRPYQYRFPGTRNPNGARGYDVWSFGEDGVESANDIGNWD